jgi:predicted O-linked N-acetylglucosamine transferase (SPINDLY family)
MSYLLANLYELHDKNKFEVIGISFGPDKNDEMRKRVSSAFDEFYDVRLKTEDEIVNFSRELKIDIAIDLMCFTKYHKFGIFVKRCAPIQVNYLGYPGTSGTNYLDYIIADKILIPKESQKYYSEKIAYLPDTYQANDSTKKISDKIFTREELGLPKDGFVFCCFNNDYKITPQVFDVWMRLLKKVENSVLWILSEDVNTSKNLKNEATIRGVDFNRIVFAKRIKMNEHLARQKVADLFIDTFPYTGHTTTSDALWVGLPVLTRIGKSFASRVSASLLNAMGLSVLVTSSEKEYEDLAIELATNSPKLKEIKNKLKNNRNTKPLFNTQNFARNIEKAYTLMYERYLKKLPIKNIEI